MKQLSNKLQTALNLTTGIVTALVQFLIGFFLSPFIVGHLGAEANGFTQLANNFVMFASLLTLAFNSMASRFISVSYHQGDLDKANRYYSSVVMVNVYACLFFLPLALLVVFNLNDVVVIQDAEVLDVQLLFACVFLNFFLGLITSLYSFSFYVKNAVYFGNVINAIRTILNASLLLVVFSVLPVKVFYTSFVGVCLSVLLLPVYIRFQKSLLPEIHFSKENLSFKYIKELFLSGIWNTINQCGHLLNTGLDMLLTNWFVSPFYMGVLAVSKVLPSAIMQIAGIINSSFSPLVTIQWAKQNSKELITNLRHSINISCILVSIPLVTFCCFSYDFYGLWQPTLDAKLLAILSFLGCFAFIPVAGTQTLYNVFTATNNLKVNSVSYILSGLLNVIVVYLCVVYYPQYAVYIIAGTSSIISVLRNITIVLPYTAKLLDMKWYVFYKDVAVTLLSCIVNALVSVLVLSLVDIRNWITLIIAMAVSALFTFAIDCYVILSRGERNMLFQTIKNRRK